MEIWATSSGSLDHAGCFPAESVACRGSDKETHYTRGIKHIVVFGGLASGGSSIKPILRCGELQVHIYLPKGDAAGKRAPKLKTEYNEKVSIDKKLIINK